MMMGLRLTEGVAEEAIARLVPGGSAAAFDTARLTRLKDGGFILCDGARIRATDDGRLRLNAVIAELLTPGSVRG